MESSATGSSTLLSIQRAISVWSAPGSSWVWARSHIATACSPSSAGAPTFAARSVAIFMSLSISASAKPESYVPGRMKFGYLLSVEPLRPLDVFTMSISTAGSSPKRCAAAAASAVANRCVAESRLLIALMACPAPTSPPSRGVPNDSNTGRTVSNASGEPPTMIVSLPFSAPLTPPETGASTRVTSAADNVCASSRVDAGSDELMSTTTLLGASAAASSKSRTTASTTVELGSMRMTTDAARAASTAVATPVPPFAANRSRAAGSRSKPVTRYPAPIRRAAIGEPMLPSPMSAMSGRAAVLIGVLPRWPGRMSSCRPQPPRPPPRSLHRRAGRPRW